MTPPKLSDYLIKYGHDFVTGMSDALTEDALAQLAEPRDETETLATCPECRCMGHHAVEVGTAERREHTPDGGWVHMSAAKIVRRTCMFCGHCWERWA